MAVSVPTTKLGVVEKADSIAVEIVKDRNTKEADLDLARKIADKMFELGLWANLSSHSSFSGVFRIAPPIVINAGEVEMGLAIMEEAFRTVAGLGKDVK